ncbi:hypothetical protein [Arsenicibacter rosenii]|uniref:Outer membrane protein beta-barrel domain-containing protein n=1 Tax=Arsenicibacter rosenii TaxID=1750698 RepID=A0A1S2VB10_9BACT|nr:hypothetical protein [Arsenicibacter rosenii]OIN55937.1 hypothetical protein BLX24_27240 [Arsenicibacter rosenii]
MKTFISCAIAFLTLVSFMNVAAQERRVAVRPFGYPKGSWMIGVQGTRTPDQLLGNNTAVHLRGGYFVADQLLLGINTTWRMLAADPIRLYSYVAGPQLRFQLTQTRISPYILASWQFGFKQDNGEQKVTITTYNPSTTPPSSSTSVLTYRALGGTKAIHSPTLGAGVTIGITPALRADLALTWQKEFYYGMKTFNGAPLQPQIGVNYVFLR